MIELFEKAVLAYIEMLKIHINTKTTDIVFHKATEEFYEILFKVAHEIWEKYVDLWGKVIDTNLDKQKNRAYELIDSLRKDIQEYAKNNEITLGTEDLLGSLVNDLENIQWTAKGFISK